MPGLSLIGAGNRMELKLGDRDAFERFSDDLLEGREVGVRVVGVVGESWEGEVRRGYLLWLLWVQLYAGHFTASHS